MHNIFRMTFVLAYLKGKVLFLMREKKKHENKLSKDLQPTYSK